MDSEKDAKDAGDRAQHEEDNVTGNPLLNSSDNDADYIDRLKKYLAERPTTPSSEEQRQQFPVATPPEMADPVIRAAVEATVDDFLAARATEERVNEEKAAANKEAMARDKANKDFRHNMAFLQGDLPPMLTDTDYATMNFRDPHFKKNLAKLNPEGPIALEMKRFNFEARFREKQFLRERASSSAYATRYGDTPSPGAYQKDPVTKLGPAVGGNNRFKKMPKKTQKQIDADYQTKLEEGRDCFDNTFKCNMRSMFDDPNGGKRSRGWLSQLANATQSVNINPQPAADHVPRNQLADKEAIQASDLDVDSAESDEDVDMDE